MKAFKGHRVMGLKHEVSHPNNVVGRFGALTVKIILIL